MLKTLPLLPPPINLETRDTLKRTAVAHRRLAELKGISRCIPNQYILINSLTLQEAKDSSAIENIVTTHDELYRSGLFQREIISPGAKEVRNYSRALLTGFDIVKEKEMLRVNDICAIQEILENNDAGMRRQNGTKLINDRTGEVVYVPPQNYHEICDLMSNLEKAINDDLFWPDVDPLIKMAVIHYQFESIHPFFDGNGRTGRIINVLYLVLKELLDIPILYLSRYIIEHKGQYYDGLRKVREENAWEDWILFMLDAMIETSNHTALTVNDIYETMQHYKREMREKIRFYSRDLVDALFIHPYIKISHLEERLAISRLTSAKYLNTLTEHGFLERHNFGRNHYFINTALFRLLTEQARPADPVDPIRTVRV